jgi:hypothetical protein
MFIYDFYNHRNADCLAPLPVINIAIQACIGVVQIVWSLFMAVLDLIAIFLHFVFGTLRFIILHVYGFFTYNIVIKCLGRVPVSESAVAFRVGGPGVGKTKFFYSLHEEDLTLLVRAKMEEI